MSTWQAGSAMATDSPAFMQAAHLTGMTAQRLAFQSVRLIEVASCAKRLILSSILTPTSSCNRIQQEMPYE